MLEDACNFVFGYARENLDLIDTIENLIEISIEEKMKQIFFSKTLMLISFI